MATIAKWVIVGRTRAVEHPLWSSFVWRNEVVDTFVEMVAAPWFANARRRYAGARALAAHASARRSARASGARRYWLPEADLVTLGDGVTVNRGCVLQTHLFHDRVMSMSTVTFGPGATLGPHGVILPAASIGAGATVGPVSLVMRGETVPAGYPLGRQPDRALAGLMVARDRSRTNQGQPGADSGDPYVPAHGNGGYKVESYELDLDYRVNSNRLTGKATITAVATHALSRLSFDLTGLRVAKVAVNGRRAGRYAHRNGKLHIWPAAADRRRRGVRRRRPVRREPGAGGQPVGRARLGGADRGRDRREPAERRRDLVPLQRPPRRQGALPDHDHHRFAVPRGRERAARLAPDARPAGPAGSSTRPHRWRPTWRPSRSAGTTYSSWPRRR